METSKVLLKIEYLVESMEQEDAKNLRHMSLCKDYLTIIEYPTIKIH